MEIFILSMILTTYSLLLGNIILDKIIDPYIKKKAIIQIYKPFPTKEEYEKQLEID